MEVARLVVRTLQLTDGAPDLSGRMATNFNFIFTIKIGTMVESQTKDTAEQCMIYTSVPIPKNG